MRIFHERSISMKLSKEQQHEIQYEVKKNWKRRLMDYVVITIAAFLYAASVSLFLDPNRLAPGGVTGISIILNRFLPVGTGTWIFLLNIPILLFAVCRYFIYPIHSFSYVRNFF